MVRAIEKVTVVTEAHISVLTISVMFGLHVIFKEIGVLKVFLTFSTLVFTLRNSSLLENYYLFSQRQKLVFTERALIAHTDVILCKDGQYFLVYSV